MKRNNETYEFDVTIIGAGIIGLAIANELSTSFENILLIEKENTFGLHVSSRNSEVIHSGIYYPQKTLKAKLCVEGNLLLYDFVKKHGITHNNCGKIIIANKNHELKTLQSLKENGIKNGLKGIKLLNAKEVKKQEPLIKCLGGLWVPSSGIINSHELMHKLEYLTKSNNKTIVYNTEVIKIDNKMNTYELSFKNLDYKASTKVVINSAGLWCDQIANMVGINDYKLHYCKGEYYKTSKYKNKINSLIYPLPSDISLGIHIVLHLDGTLGFGPNAYFVEKIDYDMDTSCKKNFLEHINHYLKLDENELIEDFAGIRPKIQNKGEPLHDFIIKNEIEKGHENFINLIGIESPGLTSSLAIAKYVKNIIV